MKKWIASVVAGAMLAAACMGGASAAVLEQAPQWCALRARWSILW